MRDGIEYFVGRMDATIAALFSHVSKIRKSPKAVDVDILLGLHAMIGVLIAAAAAAGAVSITVVVVVVVGSNEPFVRGAVERVAIHYSWLIV